MAENHYDVIIIGTGAGGGTLAYKLAPTGKKILILERGGYLPRKKDNWNPRAVNPALTITANALRVGEHLNERMK